MKQKGIFLVAVLFVTMALLVAGGSAAAELPSPTDDAATTAGVVADTPSPAEDATMTAGGYEIVAARAIVAALLRDHGLTEEQVQQRLAALSDEDVLQLSRHADQLQEGGAPPNYIWILLGALIVVVILTKIF